MMIDFKNLKIPKICTFTTSMLASIIAINYNTKWLNPCTRDQIDSWHGFHFLDRSCNETGVVLASANRDLLLTP